MSATVLCARANAQINHGPHSYGANQSWWCPGFGQVPITVKAEGSWPAELPVEHELIDGAWYSFPNGAMQIYRENAEFHGKDVSSFYRMAPVARYEASAPETPEPENEASCVQDANGDLFVLVAGDWRSSATGEERRWENFKRPLTILSEGVEL